MVDTARTQSELLTIFQDGQAAGAITEQDLRDLIVSAEGLASRATGWAEYRDTQYTTGAAFAVVADIDTDLPNNAGAVIDSQKPIDITSFYTGGVITGRNGDGLLVTIDFKARPTNVSTTDMEIWLDIGGGIPPIYRRLITFPKGNGVERSVALTSGAYTLNTWEANGATVKVRANGPVDIYDIRYVLSRTHKAR